MVVSVFLILALDLFGDEDCRGVLGASCTGRCFELETFNSSESVFKDALKSSVAKASFSCVDSWGASLARRFNVESFAGVFVLAPRAVLVVVVVLFAVVFVVFRLSVSGVLESCKRD